MPVKPKFESAVLFVADVERSKQFYVNVLEQEITMDHGVNVAFKGGFAIWDVTRAMEIVHGTSPDGTSLGRDNLELYFEVVDVDAMKAKMEASGVEFVHDVREQPWMQRVLRVKDPDGHVIEFREPMHVVITRLAREGLDAATISKRTSMPIDVVNQVMSIPGE